jgi:hypothetical protein
MGIFTKVYPSITREGENGATYETRDYRAEPTIEERWAGAVLCDRERNYYDDSDGYSHVWTGEDIESIGTWTTRFGHDHVSAKVDAFDGPYVEAIRAWLIDWFVRVSLTERVARYDADLYEAKNPAVKGARVRVVKGRKVPKGTTGEVIWVGESAYGGSRWSTPALRLGIRDEAGQTHWTAASNVERLDIVVPDPADYQPEAAMRAKAESLDTKSLARMHCAYGAAAVGLTRLG